MPNPPTVQTLVCSEENVFDFVGGRITTCLVSVRDARTLAQQIAKTVLDTSWLMLLDEASQLAYRYTVNETGALIAEMLTTASKETSVSEDFGELMVTFGSLHALEEIFKHTIIPIAELWKSRLRQNDGFDFHTVCSLPLINFGEAKYSSNKNPYSQSLDQIVDFIKEEKHFRDLKYLGGLCSSESLGCLVEKKHFGVIAAFSINGKNRQKILENAKEKALKIAVETGLAQIYLIGVCHDSV